MMEIADLIDKALASAGDPAVLSDVRAEVRRFTSHFPLPG
jgi:glycine/serine hydroxymethyltransferase